MGFAGRSSIVLRDSSILTGAPPRTPARSLAGAPCPAPLPRGRALRASVMRLRIQSRITAWSFKDRNAWLPPSGGRLRLSPIRRLDVALHRGTLAYTGAHFPAIDLHHKETPCSV